jgi:hypothetical protein
MKRFLMTMALTCVLSVTVLAGQIPSVGVTEPPPDEPTLTTTTTAPGEIPTVGLTQQMSEAALTLVQLMLGSIV